MRLHRILITAVFSLALGKTVQCGAGKPNCPKDKPCCSQFGECGTGLNCLGACMAQHSFNLSSCVPMPVCKTNDYKFTSIDSIINQQEYFGDADKYGWTTNGQVVQHKDSVLLTMAKESYGTVLSSTRGVWYGKIKATFKTSHGPGVVSAFILMSGSKDEIDWEFIGNNLDNAETNYYYQGVLNYTNGGNTAVSDTKENWHTYEIDWTPESIKWSIDGKVGRELKKADTYNATTKSHQFPQTPSIIQLSLWPGGSSLNEPGTVQWAGGAMDWDMPEFKNPGYLYLTLKELSIECYDPPKGASVNGDKSYIYTSTDANQEDVEITDNPHVLGSPKAVGFDLDRGKDDKDQQTKMTQGATHVGDNSPGKHATKTGAAGGGNGGNGGKSTSGVTNYKDGDGFVADNERERTVSSSAAVRYQVAAAGLVVSVTLAMTLMQ